MATQSEIDQQRRVVEATKDDAAILLNALGRLQAHAATYNRLNLSSDLVLDEDSFTGTGTTRAAYRAAITSVAALDTLMGAGHGTNLETFAR